MKKLNRKGFTLIELLAIIVILAIIMVVTIPTILSSLGSARQDTFDTSANTVADWFEKQYTLYSLQQADTVFDEFCSTISDEFVCKITQANSNGLPFNSDSGKKALAAAGVDITNYDLTQSYVYFQSNGRACVTLSAAGDFANVKNKTATSIGCNAS